MLVISYALWGRVLEVLDSPGMIDEEGRTGDNRDQKNMEEEERMKTTQGRISYARVE